MSNFNYCSLVRSLANIQSLNKIENLQKRTLYFLLKNYGSSHKDLLLKSGCPNMNLRRQRTIFKEMYKTLNKLNTGYINDICQIQSD